MLKKLYVDNFKCLINFDLSLNGFNVLLGRNGCGKSAVFEAVNRLRLHASGAGVQASFPFETVNFWERNSRKTQSLELESDIPNGAVLRNYKYSVTVEHDATGASARVIRESLACDGAMLFQIHNGALRLTGSGGQLGESIPVNGLSSPMHFLELESESDDRLKGFREWLANWQWSRVDPRQVAQSFARDGTETLDLDHAQFATWLKSQQAKHPRRYFEYFKALEDAIPGFIDIHFVPFGPREQSLKVSLSGKASGDGQSEQEFFLWQLSDGQRVLLNLYALLFFLQSSKGGILFIDEPDNFLAVREIAPWVRMAVDLASEKRLQVVIATHHPEILGEVGVTSGIHLFRMDNGPTRAEAVSGMDLLGLSLPEYLRRGFDDQD